MVTVFPFLTGAGDCDGDKRGFLSVTALLDKVAVSTPALAVESLPPMSFEQEKNMQLKSMVRVLRVNTFIEYV